jgi:hypothetical protein
MSNPYATAIVNNIKASIKPKTTEKTPINTQPNPAETVGRPTETVLPPQPQSMNEPEKYWNVTNWYFCIPLECQKGDICTVSICHCFCSQFWLCNNLFKCNNSDHHCRGCLHYTNNLGWLFGGCVGVFNGINYSPLGFCKNDNNFCGLFGLICHKEVSRKGNDYQLRECFGCWCIQKYEKKEKYCCDDFCDCFDCCNYGIGFGPFGLTKENCYPFWCDLSHNGWVIKNNIINCKVMKETPTCVKGCAMGCLVCYSKGEVEMNGKKYTTEKGINYCLPWSKYSMK